MKDTPEYRSTLRSKIADGDQAHELLRRLDPYMAEVQQQTLANLVNEVKRTGDAQSVYQIAAQLAGLDSVYEKIIDVMKSGERAQKTLEDLDNA